MFWSSHGKPLLPKELQLFTCQRLDSKHQIKKNITCQNQENSPANRLKGPSALIDPSVMNPTLETSGLQERDWRIFDTALYAFSN